MPVITTAVMIGGIVTYIGRQLAKNESISGFIGELSTETVNWIKPLFLKEDGTEKEVIEQLKAKPDSNARQNAVKSALEIGLEDNPNAEKFIKEIFEKISKTEEGGKIVTTITNSKNVVTGTITAGGNVNIGDSGTSQNHSGSGDNVGGNKIVNNVTNEDDLSKKKVTLLYDNIEKGREEIIKANNPSFGEKSDLLPAIQTMQSICSQISSNEIFNLLKREELLLENELHELIKRVQKATNEGKVLIHNVKTDGFQKILESMQKKILSLLQ
jgi:translation initiation factor 2B subunit (eIF-2B alpha/beta/delta family)